MIGRLRLCAGLVAIAVMLSGCGVLERAFGLEKSSPDESRVHTGPPLSIPPDYAVRPPSSDRSQTYAQAQSRQTAAGYQGGAGQGGYDQVASTEDGYSRQGAYAQAGQARGAYGQAGYDRGGYPSGGPSGGPSSGPSGGYGADGYARAGNAYAQAQPSYGGTPRPVYSTPPGSPYGAPYGGASPYGAPGPNYAAPAPGPYGAYPPAYAATPYGAPGYAPYGAPSPYGAPGYAPYGAPGYAPYGSGPSPYGAGYGYGAGAGPAPLSQGEQTFLRRAGALNATPQIRQVIDLETAYIRVEEDSGGGFFSRLFGGGSNTRGCQKVVVDGWGDYRCAD